MEKSFEEKIDHIISKPNVIGVLCADKRGLCLSESRRSTTPLLDTDSSDEGDIIGSPRQRPAQIKSENLLSGSVRSGSFNILFQVITRIFTFSLNAFILRYVSQSVLGICNVRLALLYSSILFLSREPFRRASLRKNEEESWTKTVNLIWIVVPNTVLISMIFGCIWFYYLSLPGLPESQITSQYYWGVFLICLATVIDACTEVPYIIAQYFLFFKLRIVCDTTLIAIRSGFLCFAVVFSPSNAIFFYGLGSLIGSLVVSLIYYGYFFYEIGQNKMLEIPFKSVNDFLPSLNNFKEEFLPREMTRVTWSFYKQGILKQILTEGERYLMTFFDILSFEEQGIYDLVSNLGSLAARFIFLPIEESSYFYFAQTLQRRCSFLQREKKLAVEASIVLGSLVRLMLLIGLTALSYGIPFSSTLLFLYAGTGLSDIGGATLLLRANCAYVAILAINGVTEAFSFAAMSQEQIDSFNKKLVGFSAAFLLFSLFFSKLFGSVGFYLANILNMVLRVAHSVYLIRKVFIGVDVNPFESWMPRKQVLLTFIFGFIASMTFVTFLNSRFLPVLFGLMIFGVNCFMIVKFDRDLINFFIRLYKTKTN